MLTPLCLAKRSGLANSLHQPQLPSCKWVSPLEIGKDIKVE